MIFWELGGGPLPPVAAQGEGLGDGAGVTGVARWKVMGGRRM